MSQTILIFLKIGAKEHIEDLHQNGTVYMNTLSYFRRVDDSLRGDPNEGAINLTNPKNATIRFSLLDKDIKPVSLRYGSFVKTGNLYCLYSISSNWFPNPLDFKFDQQNIEFGSLCLLIKQPGVFIARVENELKRLGYNYKHNFVKYYEEEEHLKNLTPFHKSKAYAYQKEFRFFIENEKDEPIKISIGSMKSYSEICEAKDLTSIELKVKSKT